MTIDAIPASTGSSATLAVGASSAGAIDFGGDEDWYRVTLVAGRQYRFDLRGQPSAQGTLADPFLRLLNGAGAEIVANDDAGNTLESSITFLATQSGTFFLSAGGFASSAGTFSLSAIDLSAGVDVAGSTATTATLAAGGSASGTIDAAGDQDW